MINWILRKLERRWIVRQETIEKLLKINWSQKDDEWIKNNIELFYDVDKFISEIKNKD